MTKARILIVASLVSAMAFSGCRNADGTPVSGGLAYFTQPGTQVAVTPYNDRDATSSATLTNGGVRLDAGGRAVVYLKQPADVRVETSSGVTVGTFQDPPMTAGLVEVRNPGFTGTDPVSGQLVAGGRSYLDTVLANLFTSTGGLDGLVKIAATATARPIYSKFSEVQISVKDFGAVVNGIADDTPAIQATANFLAGLGGGVLWLPPGTTVVSSAVTLGAGVTVAGAGGSASIVLNTNAGTGVFRTTAASTYSFRQFGITHSSNSTGTAIDASAGSVALFDGVVITNHAIGVKANTGFTVLSGCRLTTSAASTSGALTLAGGSTLGVVVVGGAYGSTLGSGISNEATNGVLRVFGAYLNVGAGGVAGVDLVATGSILFAYGANQVGAAVGLRTATDSATVHHQGCDWGTAGVNDRRTGAPVNYAFAGANNMTPLPLQADVIRVAQGTGGVVTTINNTVAIGFKPWVLICSNTSGGASNFTFGASYVLSAAVAPAAGTRVALYLYFDPVSGKNFETGRAATAN